MLAKLWEFDIQANVDKCKFYVIEIKYLGLIISMNKIKIDSAKVKAIWNWNISIYVKDARAFRGFCNFYHRFIVNFLKVARTLNALTKKDVPFG